LQILFGEKIVWKDSKTYLFPVRLAYQPYFFNEGTVFSSHNKSANSTFQPGFSRSTFF
jgi:hypothetical protein